MASKDQNRLIEAVADNIRRLRKHKRMTQTELAEAAGISRASVAQIEGQRYSSFTLATLEGIAAALHVAPVALLKKPEGPLTPLAKQFRSSPWAAALKPTDEELALLSEVTVSIGCTPDISLSLIAELLQHLRRLQASSAPAG